MTAPTDNTDIVAFAKAAEARAEKATPGPWYCDESGWPVRDWRQDASNGHIAVWYEDRIPNKDDPYHPNNLSFPTLSFIAASKFDVPTLARMVVRMHATLDQIDRLAITASMPGPVYVEQTSEQVEALGRIARSALTDLTVELKGSQHGER